MTADLSLRAPQNGSPSTSDLVGRLSTQLTTLVRDEVALARTEIQTKAKTAGVASGMFGAAGILSLYGIGLAIAAGVVALDLVWPLWLAVLVVMAAVFLITGILALVGRGKMRRAMPLVPTDTVERIRDDLDTVKAALKDRRRQ
ncbi:MAG TPA: phage holin family protein [Micromonosporaceae bacterium]|nr:phage holin family protein [Micromonosporaceae bacterium]